MSTLTSFNPSEYLNNINTSWDSPIISTSQAKELFETVASEWQEKQVENSDHFEKAAKIFRKMNLLYIKHTELREVYNKAISALTNAAILNCDNKLIDLYEIYILFDNKEDSLNFEIQDLFDKQEANIYSINNYLNLLIEQTDDNDFNVNISTSNRIEEIFISESKKLQLSHIRRDIPSCLKIVSTLVPAPCNQKQFAITKTKLLQEIELVDSAIQQIKQKKITLQEVQNRKYDLRNFIDHVTAVYCKKIAIKEDVQGFVWRVTNNKGVSSYCVGTIHEASLSMTQAPLVDYALVQSKKLILETTCEMNWPTIPNIFNPYRYSIDQALYNQASQRGIAIEGLEGWFDSIRNIYSFFKKNHFEGRENKKNIILNKAYINYPSFMQVIKDQWTAPLKIYSLAGSHETVAIAVNEEPVLKDENPFFTVAQTIDRVIYGTFRWITLSYFENNASRDVSKHIHFEAWQNGKTDDVPSFSSKSLLDDRNKEWINRNKVIEQMRDTDSSLCLAVGLAHFVNGNTPLLKAIEADSTLRLEKGRYDFTSKNIRWE